MIEFHPHDGACHRCHATAWELFGVFQQKRGPLEDVVECAFCGLRTRVPHVEPPKAPLKVEDGGEFRFDGGRFDGLTLAEVVKEHNGRRYLDVIRKKDERLRPMIEAFLGLTTSEVPA